MRRTIDATGLLDSTQIATDASWRRRDIGDTIKAIDALVDAEKRKVLTEPTDAMIDAAHAILSDPPCLNGDKRNTRNALRAALAAMSANQ